MGYFKNTGPRCRLIEVGLDGSFEIIEESFLCLTNRDMMEGPMGSLLHEFIDFIGWVRKLDNKVLLGECRSKGRSGKRNTPRKY